MFSYQRKDMKTEKDCTLTEKIAFCFKPIQFGNFIGIFISRSFRILQRNTFQRCHTWIEHWRFQLFYISTYMFPWAAHDIWQKPARSFIPSPTLSVLLGAWSAAPRNFRTVWLPKSLPFLFFGRTHSWWSCTYYSNCRRCTSKDSDQPHPLVNNIFSRVEVRYRNFLV